MSGALAAHEEAVRAARAFDREDAKLGPRDSTTREWLVLCVRRLDALARLRAAAPADPLIAVHDAADRLSMARLERRLGANRRAAA